MNATVKRAVSALVGKKRIASARELRDHAKSIYAILRGREAPLQVSDFGLAGAHRWRRAVIALENATGAEERGAAAIRILNLVATDTRYLLLVDTQYAKSQVPPDLFPLVLGAAHYATGDLVRARQAFEEAAAKHPSALAFTCLARCASQGDLDSDRAADLARSGLASFPRDLGLTLTLAASRYRLRDTAGANQTVAPIHELLLPRMNASSPVTPQLQSELVKAIRSKSTKRNYQYSEQQIVTYWDLLWTYMQSYNRFQHGWGSLRWLQRSKLSKALREHASDTDTFVNFGAFCAHLDADLAREFASITFHGVDLGAEGKELNERAFGAPNLHFHDAFITNFLDQHDWSRRRAMLFHARTTTLFYPEFVRQFYRECAVRRIRRIALWENNAVSYVTGQYYDFGSIPDGSIAYRDVMFIHDYKTFLEDAGYEIVVEERSPSNTVLIDDVATYGDGHVFLVARLI